MLPLPFGYPVPTKLENRPGKGHKGIFCERTSEPRAVLDLDFWSPNYRIHTAFKLHSGYSPTITQCQAGNRSPGALQLDAGRPSGFPPALVRRPMASWLYGPVSEEMEIAQVILQLCDAHTCQGNCVMSIYHDYSSCLGVMRLTKNL